MIGGAVLVWRYLIEWIMNNTTGLDNFKIDNRVI